MFPSRFADIIWSFRRLQRFPLETIISIALTAFLIFSIYWENLDEGVVLRTTLSGIVTFFLATGATLLKESIVPKNNRTEKSISQGVSAALLVLPVAYGVGFFFVNDYLGAESLESITIFLLHLAGFLAILFVAPYVNFPLKSAPATKRNHSAEKTSIPYSNYFTFVAWTKLMSIIVGWSVLALGFIAIGSVVTLFDLDSLFKVEKIFMTWAAISLSLIAPLYGLIHFPEASLMRWDTYESPRFLSFLVRFVGVPAILVYFVILYAYSIRVLIHFNDWPKGIISWMVIGFSSFGYLVYAFAKPYETGSKTISGFRKFFPYMVLPQVLMLFYAIYLRVAQYDLTMNRYFVIIFGIWLTGISLYFLGSKTKSLTILPMSLAGVAIVISFGPWSVFSLPLERQYERLIHHMEQAGMFRDGAFLARAGNSLLDAKLESSIVSEIEYVCQYRNCGKLRPLFAKTLENAEKKKAAMPSWNGSNSRNASHLTSWEAADAIKTEMNVHKRSDADETPRKYAHISTKNGKEPYPLTVTGYDFVTEVIGSGSNMNAIVPIVRIDPDSNTVTVQDSDGSETLPLTDFTDKILSKYGNSPSYGSAEPEDLSFSMVFKKYEITVFLREFSYMNPKYSKGGISQDGSAGSLGEWYGISGIALLKKRG